MSVEHELKHITITFFDLKPTTWKMRKKEGKGIEGSIGATAAIFVSFFSARSL
jgi:hypothetical protein